MNDQELIELLRSHDQAVTRGWRCPDENLLAAYIHKQLSEEKRRQLDSHFASCNACLETLGLLIGAKETPREEVPAALLVRARSLAEFKPGAVWRWRWALATATACALIVVLLSIWRARDSQYTPGTDDLVAMKTEPTPEQLIPPSVKPSVPSPGLVVQKPKSSEKLAPVLRGANDELKPTLIFPREGANVNIQQQSIRWTAVAEASFYEVTIVAPDGGHILTQPTNATEFSLRAQNLPIGGKYFVSVTAHLNGNRTVKSDLVGFHVNAKP